MAEERHPRIKDFVSYLKDINDDTEHPVIVAFEGLTVIGGGAQSLVDIPFTVPEDRHYYIYEVFGYVQPDASDPMSDEAGLTNLAEVKIMVDNNPYTIRATDSSNRINLAHLIGTTLNTKDGYRPPFPYHLRPKVTITVSLFTLAGFPAAQRRIGIALSCMMIKRPSGG